jgi:hypothetical protein
MRFSRCLKLLVFWFLPSADLKKNHRTLLNRLRLKVLIFFSPQNTLPNFLLLYSDSVVFRDEILRDRRRAAG